MKRQRICRGSRFACSRRATRALCESSRRTTAQATLLLVAFDADHPVGFVLAHELPRRHGDRANLFVYEVDVAESHQRRGIASALLAGLAGLARERGIRVGFVLTEPDNEPANALYRRLGGTSQLDVEWTFSYADD